MDKNKKVVRDFTELQDSLNEIFSDNDRIGKIEIHKCKPNLKDAQYLLMNVEIDNKWFNTEIRIESQVELSDIFEQIKEGVLSYIVKIDEEKRKAKLSKYYR